MGDDLALFLLAMAAMCGMVGLVSGGPGEGYQDEVKQTFEWGWRHARRLVILVIGSSIVILGLALLFLPGPAFIVIPAGLAVLATEFVWAKRLLRKARKSGSDFGKMILGGGDASSDESPEEKED